MKVFFFDLDDTLYCAPINECNEYLIAQTAAKFNLPTSAVKKAFEDGKKTTKTILGDVAAQHNRLLYIQHMLELLGKSPVEEALELYNLFWDHYLEMISPRPGVLKTFRELKKNNISIGICTDLTACIQHRKIKQLNLTPYIDYLVTSEEAGEEKPSAKMFDLCSQKSGVDSGHIVFVGDSYQKDYLGAARAGMQAVWYQESSYPDFYCFFERELRQWISDKSN